MQDKLLILRKREGISIAKIAFHLNLTPKTYSLKERGVYEFTQDEMFKLSEFFNLKIDEIFLPRSHHNGYTVTN